MKRKRNTIAYGLCMLLVLTSCCFSGQREILASTYNLETDEISIKEDEVSNAVDIAKITETNQSENIDEVTESSQSEDVDEEIPVEEVAGDEVYPARTKGTYFIRATYKGGPKNGLHDSYTMAVANVATNININTVRSVQVTANYTGNAGNSLISGMYHTTTTEHAALYSDQGKGSNNHNYLYAPFKLNVPLGYKIASVSYSGQSTRGTLYHLYLDNANLKFDTTSGVKTWNSVTANLLTTQASSDGVSRQIGVRSMVDIFYNAGIGTTSVNHQGEESKVTQSITISPIQMQLQYDVAGGVNGPAAQTITYDTTCTLSSTVPQRTGYSFGGWKIGGVTYAKGQILSVQQVNTLGNKQGSIVKATAIWNPNAYQLAFDLNGGSAAVSAQTVYYDGKIKLPGTPVKDGYAFVGWQVGSDTRLYNAGQELAVANYVPSQGTIIACKAVYQVGSYSIRFYRSEEDRDPYQIKAYSIDETGTLLTAPQKDGYTFIGWSILGATYSQGQSIRNLTKTKGEVIDAFAKWQPIQYSITYDGNGATTGNTANQDYLVYDRVYRLQPNGYQRQFQITYETDAVLQNQVDSVAAEFIGWALTQEQNAGETVFENNATVQGLSKQAKAVTLFARWDDTPLTIRLPLAKKEPIYTPAKNEKGEDGYLVKQFTFLGWKEKGASDQQLLSNVQTITQDKTLQAVFKTTETFSKKAQNDSATGQIMNKIDELKESLTNGYNLSEEQAQKVIEAIEKGSAVTLKMGDAEYTIVKNPDGTLSIQVASLAQGVKELMIPSEVKIGKHVYPITEIYKECFKNNHTIEKVTVGTNITKIGDLAFSGCTSLKEVKLSEGLITIGNRAFEGCKSLVSLKCPASLQTIGNYAFYKCTKLKTISLKKGLLKIGNYSFYKCTALLKIRIPDTVLRVGKYAFGGCSKMQQAITSKSCSLMGEGVFSECKSLEKLTLKDALTEIPVKGFMGCKKLKSVSIPKKVMKIGTRAFYNCSALKSVKIKTNYLATVAKESFKRTKKGIRFTVPTKKKSAYAKLLKGKY